MFNELIYTRCRQGIDIAQKGRQISSDGYKVYSCTPAIMEEGTVDLPLLANVAQAKQPYTDPGFMDDAYLFYVPDTGANFFINFHPIPFDANAQGDYSHRPGNFVNHALIGDFSKLYPYKMFQDDAIWNAKTKGEAYYYENPPAEAGLPVRGDIVDPPGQYKLDEISAFVADGRQEALKKAVAFLIEQYKEEPEKRKYLVIRDDSSKNIELWIAAIECAFSPKIACAVPFATRMDKFTNANRYTVKNGVYQLQMNLQDPNQKQRFRAMIVGLDERDKANASAARPLANSPFVLLDGKQKQAMFEADISNRYYQLVTKFNDEHNKFCGEFLQAFGVTKPSVEIFELYEIFTAVNEPAMVNARILESILGKLNKYQVANSSIFKDIYKRVDAEVPRLMQEDLSCALNIINWLQRASEIVGDTGAKQRLTETVCNAYTNIIFGKADNATKRSYWKQIQNTVFVKDVARVVTDMEKIKDNSFNLNAPANIATYVAIYIDAILLIGTIEQQNLKSIIRAGINVCSAKNDENALHDIVTAISRLKSINVQDFLFSLAKDGDKTLGEFVIKYIINHDAYLFASDSSVQMFCKRLCDERLGSLASIVLLKRANSLSKPPEMERFIEYLHGMDFVSEEVLAEVFEFIDSRVSIMADNTPKLVELLQAKRPRSAKCKNSAHIFAINILSDNRRKQSLIETFKNLTSQDFPAAKEEKYVNKFVELVTRASLNDEEQLFMLGILFCAPKEYLSAYINKLLPIANKNNDKWNALFKYAFDNRNKQVEDTIIQALADSRQNEKSLAALGGMIKDENSQRYFNSIADKVKDVMASQKEKSGIGKPFGGFFG